MKGFKLNCVNSLSFNKMIIYLQVTTCKRYSRRTYEILITFSAGIEKQ